MRTELVCIECPKGCIVSVSVKNKKILRVSGNKCQKGKKYAVSEILNPSRMITSTVAAQGLSVAMIPVRTDKPIPKNRIPDAMNEIRSIVVRKPVKAGEVLQDNFINLSVRLLVTRSVD